MKKVYQRPEVLVERFELTQMLTSCSLLIGYGGASCVLKDPDSTSAMKNLAVAGYFTASGCGGLYPSNQDADDGACYHTSVNLAFYS